MNPNHYIAIMAGGVGSRFWPASTVETPKQFLDILGNGKSLIRMTFERFLPLVPAERILIVTNKKYKEIIQEHIPELPVENILCEPSRNNTGPSVAYTALRLKAINPNAIFVMAPADHIIEKEEIFRGHIREALTFAKEHQRIVTLGITPTRPDTGYGYIQTSDSVLDGIIKVEDFKEKPNLEKAKTYLQSGKYLWNAGIFVWSVQRLLHSFETYAPDILDVLTEDVSKYGTSEEQEYVDRVYPNSPNISIDYAIMENDDEIYTIPVDIGWSDLGTWSSLYEYLEKDENGNVLQGKIHSEETTNTIIKSSDDVQVVVRGLDDFIVMVENNAVLIYPKSKEQDIKAVVNTLS